MSKTRWKIIFDMCLNISASGAPIAVLQLIIYPYLASHISSEEYGLMITLYSLWIVISNSLGNVLNNIRLLRNTEYEKEGLKGDFPFLLRDFMIINFIVIFIGTVFYIKKFNIIYIVFSLIISMLILLKAYCEVGFRIKLDYISILINGILQCFGFVFGLIFFYFTRVWQFIFLFGFLLNTIFTILKTGMLKESFVRTRIYKNVSKDAGIYTLATFSGNTHPSTVGGTVPWAVVLDCLKTGEKMQRVSILCSLLPDCRCSEISCLILQSSCLLCYDGLDSNCKSKQTLPALSVCYQVFCYNRETCNIQGESTAGNWG